MTTVAPKYFDHPVFRPDRLHLETAPMRTLRETLCRWLWNGATGGLITGAARVGKTTAISALIAEFKARDGTPIPACYVSMPLRDQRTVASVFRQLCWSADLRVTNHDRADHLADRYVHYLADCAAEARSRHVVLVVDEMQRLAPQQFGPFAELHDKLLRLGIRLAVLFIANHEECERLLEVLEGPAFAHVHGRFFTHRASYRGLNSRQEVQACLQQYDELRYPAGGPTYTGYFLPEAVADGWRLASLAGDLWRAFSGYKKAYHLDAWGMQYFTVTVNTLLADFLHPAGVEQFDEGMVDECIRISGLVTSLVQSEQ